RPPERLQPLHADLHRRASGTRVRADGDRGDADADQGTGHRQRVLGSARAIIHPREQMTVQVDEAAHRSGGSSGEGGLASSSDGVEGTRYSSPNQRPRSMRRQRSEQKGNAGFRARGSTGFWHTGQSGMRSTDDSFYGPCRPGSSAPGRRVLRRRSASHRGTRDLPCSTSSPTPATTIGRSRLRWYSSTKANARECRTPAAARAKAPAASNEPAPPGTGTTVPRFAAVSTANASIGDGERSTAWAATVSTGPSHSQGRGASTPIASPRLRRSWAANPERSFWSHCGPGSNLGESRRSSGRWATTTSAAAPRTSRASAPMAWSSHRGGPSFQPRNETREVITNARSHPALSLQ